MIILKIISPEREVLSTEVEMVELPGEAGRFAVLRSHAPLISSLVQGLVSYRKDGQMASVAVGGGFVEVKEDVVTVCIE